MSQPTTLLQHLLLDGFHRLDCNNYSLYFKGLVFLPGLPAGEPSLKALVERMAQTPLKSLATQLRGVYGLIVVNQANQTAIAVNDNFGLYKLYYDDDTISGSFKEILQKRGRADCRIDDERLVEYLAHGSVYTERTFVDEIKKVRGNQLSVLDRGEDGLWRTRLEDKAGLAVEQDATSAIENYFHQLDTALSERHLSADITGGLDSRLNLALLMTTGLKFELALSGRDGSVDVEIGRQVANTAGYSMFTSGHDLSKIADALTDSFEHGDWQTDPLKFHRVIQFDRDRQSRGIDLICHGGGGELFKDFLWLQDFPFLGIKKPNYPRFYALRVAPMSCRSAMSPEGVQLMDDVRRRTLQSFEQLGSFDNVTGYLNAVIRLRAIEFYGRNFSNHINLGIDVVAPFLELDIALAGLDLSVSERLMNAWHRKLIDKHAPKIAALQSTEGYAPTSGLRFLREVPGYLAMQGRRVMRKSSQKLLGKSLFLEMGAAANDDTNLMSATRQTELAAESVAILRQRQLFDQDTRLDDLRDLHVGRSMALGMFLDRFQNLTANPRSANGQSNSL